MLNRTLLAMTALFLSLASSQALAYKGFAIDKVTGEHLVIHFGSHGYWVVQDSKMLKPTWRMRGKDMYIAPGSSNEEIVKRIKAADAGKAAKGELTGDYRDQGNGLETRQDFQGLQKPIN